MAEALPDDPVARAKAIALKLTATTAGPGDDLSAGMMGVAGMAGMAPAPSSESGMRGIARSRVQVGSIMAVVGALALGCLVLFQACVSGAETYKTHPGYYNSTYPPVLHGCP